MIVDDGLLVISSFPSFDRDGAFERGSTEQVIRGETLLSEDGPTGCHVLMPSGATALIVYDASEVEMLQLVLAAYRRERAIHADPCIGDWEVLVDIGRLEDAVQHLRRTFLQNQQTPAERSAGAT